MKSLKYFLGIFAFLLTGWQLCAQSDIHDADNNTKVTTEAVPNEDQIRFYLGGTQYWHLTPLGQWVTSNSNRCFRFGYNAGNSLTSGSDNVFMGYRSGQSTTTGKFLVGIGRYTLRENTTGYSNIALGSDALLANTTGYANMAIGTGSMVSNTTGRNNTAVGVSSLSSNVSGLQNIAIGTSALYNTNASSNVGIGYQAGFGNTTGNNNILIGNKAGYSNSAGIHNTFIGAQTGYSNTGSNNVFIGYQAGYNETGSDKLYIDNSNTASPLIYGDFSTDIASINGKLGVGTMTPSARIHSYDSGNDGDILIQDSYPFLSFRTSSGAGNGGLAFIDQSGVKQGYLYYSASSDLLKMYRGNSSSAGINIPASNDIGIGTASPQGKLHVEANNTSTAYGVIYSESTYSGNSDRKAVRGYAVCAPGYGYGGYFQGGYRGVYAFADATTYTGTAYGVYGKATGSAGTRYGVYGTATGGDRNYAVYGSGDIKASSQIFIGTTTAMEDAASTYELLVDGEIICEELKVEDSGTWPDYVFDDSYKLKSLEEVEAFIASNKHLPNVPSAADIEKEGFFIGDMHKRTIEKIEELTLYAIEANKRIKSLEEQNNKLQKAVEDLMTRLEKLEK